VRGVRDTNVLVSGIAEDPDDNAVQEAAVEYHADVVISDDEHLLALQTFRGLRILSPAAFLSALP
jgi:predicted nucleic acid-binding protein